MAEDQIQEVKDKTDIAALINTYVPLKKSGKHFKANCPFHDEKTPSFIVSPELQMYKCFGCGKAGDVYTFMQELEGMSFAESLQTLADRAGVKLKKYRSSEREDRQKRLIDINKKASDVFHFLLTEHKSGKAALEYLTQRGISEDTIDRFQLGYSPNKWDFLGNYLLKKGFTLPEIIESGVCLTKKSGRGYYDRFRGRLIFPLVDHRKNTVGFSARALFPDQEPKYINSPETIIFSKSNFLYGFSGARSAIKKQGEAIVVEGTMDVLSSFQAGIKNIIAPMGTALTTSQLNNLSRLTDTILFCFDSDTAGTQATVRGIELSQKKNMNVKVIVLPSGKDPDDVVRDSVETFKTLVDEAVSVTDYYFNISLSSHDPTNALGKKKISQELLPMIKKVTNSVERGHYVRRLSNILDVSESVLSKALSEISSKDSLEKVVGNLTANTNKQSGSLEEHVISLLLHAPLESAQRTLYKLGKNDFADDGHQKLFAELKQHLLGRKYKFDVKKFQKKLDVELSELLSKGYLKDLGELLEDEELLERELEQALQLLKKRGIKRSLKDLSLKIKAAEEIGDSQQSEKLQEQFQELANKLN